jgi:membrane-bound lytic murein transglycosylase A
MLALASCVSPRRGPRTEPPRAGPPPAEAPRPEPANAIEAGVRAGPRLEALGLSPFAAGRALTAFRASCPDVTRRADASGLTRPADWATACAAAAGWAPADALAFFAAHLEPVVVGEGNAFATGYYEPEIRGSRERRAGYEVPVYAKPPDLLETNPQTGERGRGRIDADGRYVLYYERAEIEQGALAGRGLEIAWAADPVELFFLQIQGSGRLRMPDGSVMRIGYAGQNGREYVAIGRLMRERGLLEAPITMQKIVDWLHAHPEEGRALMRENRSYVFFQELTGPGPLGALGRAVTPAVTVAADPRFVPLGAPVLLSGMDNGRANGLWVAQDTGGAIRGANRFDTFWGAGAEAAATAGAMSSRGRAYLLLPRGTVARLQAARADGAPPQR